MVINYKQLREKRDQVKESFRRNEDLTPACTHCPGNC